MDHLLNADAAVSLLTLTALEVVLGIDNIIFIAILVGRLPESQRNKARIIGLSLAMFMRIALLLAIRWVMQLDKYPFFELPWPAHDEKIPANFFTAKDLVLFVGGLFLIGKSTLEIHHKIETGGVVEAIPHEKPGKSRTKGFASVIAQILLIDIVFSLDSVITAVGMAKHVEIMIAAVVIAIGVMLVFSGYIARFVDRHPTIKMLALSFLILIGVMLIAESMGQHVNKGYIYFAMAFSLGVESLNIWVRGRSARAAAKLGAKSAANAQPQVAGSCL